VGGGLAGLATAALLNARGAETVVLERSGSVGGRWLPFERGGVRFDLPWAVDRKGSAIEGARADAKLDALSKVPLALKLVGEKAGALATGSFGFVMRSAAGSWSSRLTVRGALAKTTHKEERLDHFYDADQIVGEAGAIMNAFAGPAAAETRSKPEGAFALAREVVLDQARIIGFEGGIESWVSAWRAKAGTVRTGAAVERVVVEEGRVRGVALAGGEEILGSSVVLAVGGADARALFQDQDWLRLPGDERLLLEALAPRPGLSVGFRLRERLAEPFFAFAAEPPAWIVGIGDAIAARAGLPLGDVPGEAELARLAEKVEASVAKLIPNFGARQVERAHVARPIDDPAAPLAGGRERPPVSLGGFDNLYLVGESTNAPHFGLERIFASARQAARLIG
jgi:phytoene dehydrogenase-like protein